MGYLFKWINCYDNSILIFHIMANKFFNVVACHHKNVILFQAGNILMAGDIVSHPF